MNDTERREDILQLDAIPADLRDRLRRQVMGMLHQPLSLWERLLLAWVAVLMVGLAVFCALMLFRTDLAASQRFYLVVTLPLAGVVAVWSFHTLRRGTRRPMKDDVLVEGAAWLFFVIVVCWELITGRGESAVVAIIVAIVLVGFPITWGRVRTSELRIRETVLRIALHSLDSGGNADRGARQYGKSNTETPRDAA
ncbi:MAG: hypothetical protein JSV65_05820 [Armatimonadota bacterium]|nr:MAG: hypothetical protein JSV65_05820 [Armatimonadota bacterium]